MSKPVPDKLAPAYFAVSPLMLFPETLGRFSVYLRQGAEYVLYADSEERFTERHRRLLHESGVQEIYVKAEQREHFARYVEGNLGRILSDEGIGLRERSRVFMDATTGLVREVFDERLPAIRNEHFERIRGVVEQGIRFFTRDKTLAAVAPFISHDYKAYTHCVHVFLYTVTVLNTFGQDEDELFQCGLGAMLHDLGKLRVPREVLNKKGPLARHEQDLLRSHPLLGVSLCANLPMSQNSLNCILFHHERVDGRGYPAGLAGEGIPLSVRVVAVCNAYDNLTTERPGQALLSPYEALRSMREDMRGAFDTEAFKGLVQVLSGAALV